MNIPAAAPDHEGSDLDFPSLGAVPTGAPAEVPASGSKAWIVALLGLVALLVATGGLLSTPGSGSDVCLLEQILERIAPTLVFDNPLV